MTAILAAFVVTLITVPTALANGPGTPQTWTDVFNAADTSAAARSGIVQQGSPVQLLNEKSVQGGSGTNSNVTKTNSPAISSPGAMPQAMPEAMTERRAVGAGDGQRPKSYQSPTVRIPATPENQSAPQRVPTSTLNWPKGGYTIQLFSTTNVDEAQRRITTYSGKNLRAFQQEGIVHGVKRYRVCTGHYATLTEASTALNSVIRVSGETTAFVQKDTATDSTMAPIVKVEEDEADR